MSHFTVLVIGDDVEKQLAPFQENNMSDCPREYLVFKDVTEELEKNYREDKTDCFVDPDGNAFCRYNQRFENTNRSALGFDNHEDRYVCPIGWTEAEVPVSKVYKTFEEFAEVYSGYKKDDIIGKYGYWENPNAKWDWYSIGGRWAGKFRIKPEVAHKYKDCAPNFSYGWLEDAKLEVLSSTRVDQARFEDIDFEKPRKEAEDFASKVYDTMYPVFKDLPPVKPWSEYTQLVDDKLMTIDEARDEYNKQPRILAVREESKKYQNDKSSLGQALYWIDDIGNFNLDRSAYIQAAGDIANSTFAVLKNGKWYERGKMGWFACVSDEKDPETWNSVHKNLLTNLDPNTLLTVVDCHI